MQARSARDPVARPSSGSGGGVTSVPFSFKTRRALALGAVALAMLFALPRFLTHTPYQRLGVRLDWSTPRGAPRVLSVIGPPGQGLLRKDDVILAVGGQPITRSTVYAPGQSHVLSRGPLALTIERNGQSQTITVPPLTLRPWQRARLYALPLITVIAAPLVAILLVSRRPDLDA